MKKAGRIKCVDDVSLLGLRTDLYDLFFNVISVQVLHMEDKDYDFYTHMCNIRY